MSNWRVKEQLLPKKREKEKWGRGCGKNTSTGPRSAPQADDLDFFLDEADTSSGTQHRSIQSLPSEARETQQEGNDLFQLLAPDSN